MPNTGSAPKSVVVASTVTGDSPTESRLLRWVKTPPVMSPDPAPEVCVECTQADCAGVEYVTVCGCVCWLCVARCVWPCVCGDVWRRGCVAVCARARTHTHWALGTSSSMMLLFLHRYALHVGYTQTARQPMPGACVTLDLSAYTVAPPPLMANTVKVVISDAANTQVTYVAAGLWRGRRFAASGRGSRIHWWSHAGGRGCCLASTRLSRSSTRS